MFINRRMDKTEVYSYNEILYSSEKELIIAMQNNMASSHGHRS